MFRVRNKALDKALEDFGAKELIELPEEKIDAIARRFGILLPMKLRVSSDPKGGPRTPLNKFEKIKVIEGNFAFSEYMPEDYWREDQTKIATDYELLSRIKTIASNSGTETFELFAEAKLGVFNLLPGEEESVLWTEEWISEYLIGKGGMEILEIIDEENGDKLEREILMKKDKDGKEEIEGFRMHRVSADGKVKGDNSEVIRKEGVLSLSEIPYKELLKMAKDKGIGKAGISKLELINILSEYSELKQ